jgi:GH43 family beta-xylosidase
MKSFLFTLLLCVVSVNGYTNPVQGDRDSPDPGVIYHNHSYYAVTTEGWDGHYFPIWQSTKGTDFNHVGWVMPNPPSWTKCCDYWAPEIHLIDGKFTVYYTATAQASGLLSIGVTQATNILGPYFDKGSHRFDCRINEVFNI